MKRFVSRTCACCACCLSLLLDGPAQAVTGARLAVDGNPTTGSTTYMASVNDTDNRIDHMGTTYSSMLADPDVAIGSIPPRSSPSKGQVTAYTRSHPMYTAMGLGFERSFPNGVSGGYRYKLQCSRVGFSNICHVAPGARAVTHYRTTCNGKPVQFKATAWSGKDPGELTATLVSMGATLASPVWLTGLNMAYEFAGGWYMASTLGQAGAVRMRDMVAMAERSWWLPNPENGAMRGAIARAGPVAAFLAFTAYYEIASAVNPKGALYAEVSYINFDAEGDSRVTATLEDNSVSQHIVIDNCLELTSIAQDLPYMKAKGESERLVPDVNDALVTTVFRRKLPRISASKTCLLSVDDSGQRFSGTCKNAQGVSVETSIDRSNCPNSTDVINDNGTLRCVGARIPQPQGSYLKSCRTRDWNGSTLRASCGVFDAPRFPVLDYAGACQPGSTVSFDASSNKLRCDSPRVAP